MEQLDPTPISAEEFYQMISEYLTPRQVEFVREAYNFAAEKHAAQKRASGEPYIIHPLGVATILAQLKMDDVTLAAAFLHDVVEDTDTTLEQLTDIFGLEVAGLVDGVTKLGKIEYISREEQQVENYRKMFLAMAKDIRVVLIKLADRLHNMRTMKYMPPHKQKRISNETLEIYAPLAHRLGIYAIKWELEDLSFRYLEPQHYYELVEEVKIKRHEREAMVQEAMDELRQLCSDAGIRCEIQGRPKSFYSIYRKMKRDNKTINEIYDLLAVRVLVDTVKDCYGVLGIVHGKWKPIPGRFKDYIAVPKSNGYQSLHTTVVSSSGSPLEIQIRTFEMHKVSEYGVAAHWRYKESGGSKMPSTADKNVDAKMAWLRQLLEWHRDMRDPHEFVDTVKMDVFSDEVFVFTPQGDVIDLPFGSVPIDFAYRIHTGVGNSCVGAKVNGKIVPLDYKLKNGDIVEIITSKTSPGPSRDWIDIVGSSQTKNKIKQFFKKERREENIATGRDMLERECRRLGYDPTVIMTSETLKDVASRCHLDGSEENLLAALGYGGIMLNTVMVKLIDIYKKQQRKNTTKNLSQLLSELKPRTLKTNKASHGILVKGEDDIMVKLAKCCNPIPGDPIIGYITRGHGVSVHRADCPNVLANKEEADRMIEVSWNVETDTTYKVVLRLSAVDQPGVMANIMMVASETKVNINSLNAHANPDKTAYVDLGLDISSLDQLNYIISRMRRIKGVYKVERKISGV
ncbi:MAG: bifunctional (p)ppGpp synthetase/guanosine-3',5'-bis(diphosphate) 3'-pyrophosphohydrolase [Acidaminococcus sp.]|jgi:GTP pyrophosphokinase|nr:bifunctional (p)ppGpp synthetase/guanosine-3',5'-bis(diphosphate) 3'-pyrophosphohydrolase [Acidaminococcus sp.]MCI2100132.1 bifunctional (p)ppGpp synthetase/guanosine-3',5'-bis(diphosphate) 3'-pyrophosphohydrolase [Acidaminococcus sp.]MCI2114451.1 bifunctional (p)ppGpp synthetase/guanosine-3',5'-bis(diphosphate) 3'-pyrophosphohydrolase [Acidaminococcus sp.]MCI2116386.1 bifunctional (p)ppGpp synthetase/guanosine-3',5'-bis(diphosphate) 3'-pyrophosphohydrolase [Acidaminococcus sp.]